MQIPVLIEPVAGNGYRARGPEPFALTAEGTTPEEALQKLHEQVTSRAAAGTRFVSIEVSREEHPLAQFAGYLKDHPLLERWKQAMADYRKQRDTDPDMP
jgi:hypothetical protein